MMKTQYWCFPFIAVTIAIFTHGDCMKMQFLADFLMSKRNAMFHMYDGCLGKTEKIQFVKNIVKRDENFIKKIPLFVKPTFECMNPLNRLWIIADGIDCNITEFLNKINTKSFFLDPKSYLFLIDTADYAFYINALATMNIFPITKALIGVKKAGTINLHYLYKIGMDGDLVIETYGSWKNASGIRISHSDGDLAVARRRNFRKYPIKAGNVLFDDKNLIISDFDDIPETPDSFFKQDMPILFNLLQSLNATLQLTVYDYHGYGAINKSTGKIIMDGMIGDLLSEKIDIASTMYLTPYRLNLFQPLSPIDLWSVKFFLKRPSLSYVRDIYILTLSRSVWIATGIMTLLFFVTIYLALQWETGGEGGARMENITRGSVRRITVSDTILLYFEALCQQGTLIEPLRFAGRLTVLLLFLLFMFIYVAYSAGILVLLRSTANINTLHALSESRYEVGGLNKSYVKHYFESPKSGILRTLYVKKIGSNSYLDAYDGLEKVRNGGFAFFAPIVVSYKYFLRNFTNYDVCALQEIAGYMNMKSYPAVPKRSGYKEVFKIWLLRLQETGIAMRAKVRVVRKPQCNNQAGIFQSVRIFDCFYVLLIFVYGTLIAIFVLILERIFIKYSTSKM